jgi:hypothetical protein
MITKLDSQGENKKDLSIGFTIVMDAIEKSLASAPKFGEIVLKLKIHGGKLSRYTISSEESLQIN